jgi:nucleoside-diphosphate-sugar epimerase
MGKRAIEQKQMNVLVTGGSGFLGQALCRELLAQGHQVCSYQRTFSAELEQFGVKQFLGALHDQSKIRNALQDQDAVLHNAAKASGWGSWDDFYQTNVLGTQNIIEGCLQCGIQKLVYTSTPSVVHQGRTAVAGGNENNTPYATHFSAHYPHTKMLAEKLLLAANGNQLATVALRPRLIWGPGDTQLLPRLVARAKTGKLRFIGSGSNKMDCTYIDNVVQAHLLALEKCAIDADCAGKAYFISNDEPKPIREIVNGMLSAADAPIVTRSISFGLAYSLGVLCEGLWRLFHLKGEPPMTRFLAEQLSTEHWYDCSAAKRDLGYTPNVSIADGLLRLRASLNSKADV